MTGIIFVLSSFLAAYFFRATFNRLHNIAETRVLTEADLFTTGVSEHAFGGLQALRSASGFFSSSEHVTRSEFYRYIERSRFLETYPGFQTFGYAPVVTDQEKDAVILDVSTDTSLNKEGYPYFSFYPDGKRDKYLPLVYIYPEKEVGFLMGLDSFGNAVRTENANRARDIGDISVSGIIELGEDGTGLIVAMPLYNDVFVPASLDDRRQKFSGILSTVIDLKSFFGHILSGLRIADFGIGTSIVGRTNVVIPITKENNKANFFSKFYGHVEINKKLTISKSTEYDLIFSVPVGNMLTPEELAEPFVYILIFIVASFLLLSVILILQRSKTIVDLKKRYSFISTLSHQLRTPITRLRWGVESLLGSSKNQKEDQQVMDDVISLQSIIDHLLEYIELSEAPKLKLEKVTAKYLCEEVVKIIVSDRVECLFENSKTAKETLNVDIAKIKMVMLYVIENALTYSPKDKKVSVTLRVADQNLEIKITDYGYGIPLTEQPNVFTEFFRASNASLGKNEGSGVSLFISKKIVELHGGTIQFVSTEGEGSEFLIRLPVVQ